MTEPDTIAVGYARPPRLAAGLFAGRFVVLGTINLLLGGVQLLAATATLVFVAAVWLGGHARWTQVPFDWVVMATFAAACGALVSGGSVGSFWRLARSRAWLRAGLAGDLTVNAVAFAMQAAGAGPFAPVVVPTWATAVTAARAVYAGVALYCYTDVRADFYFKPDRPLPRAAPVVPWSATVPRPPPASDHRFEVVGIDATTGQRRHLLSRAPTAELARKSAVALGMAADSISVQPVRPE